MTMLIEEEETPAPAAVRERCAGLDVHRSTIVACATFPLAGGRLKKMWKEFATTAPGLGLLVAWLKELGVTYVGMEATGVYWMPVYAALEVAGGFDLTVVNPHHAKALRKRKTDVKDAEWLAYLVRHDQVNKSFVPAKPFRDLRDLTRYRRSLVEAQSSERRRLIKLLEAADIKLAGVMSDVFGVSGRAILRALISGGHSPAEMAKLARGKLRKKRPLLIEALSVDLDGHRRGLLAMQLARVEAAEADIAVLDQQIATLLAPYKDYVELLTTVPGIDWLTAVIIIAEVGVDLSAFPTDRHFAAWIGVAPGNNESAGRAKPIGARKGNPYLTTALCNAATSAARRHGSFFKATYHRLKSRRGGGRATLAVAHKVAIAVYHILTDGTPFRDLGEGHHDTKNVRRTAGRYVQRLQRLGFVVTLQPIEPATAAVA
jgi:transposase